MRVDTKRLARDALDALIEQLEHEVTAAEAIAETTRAGLTHAETRAENDKDTRAIEASYLARGQALRVEELGEVAARLRVLRHSRPVHATPGTAALGSVVGLVEATEPPRWFLLLPVGGGRRVQVGACEVSAVSVAAPMGRALLGVEEDDDVDLVVGGRKLHYSVVCVA